MNDMEPIFDIEKYRKQSLEERHKSLWNSIESIANGGDIVGTLDAHQSDTFCSTAELGLILCVTRPFSACDQALFCM